ncbi:MAG: DUF6524 family protein [Thiohalomonadales bacterium]
MGSHSEFDWTSILIRWFFALLLVFSTYNPEGYSYYHWAIQDLNFSGLNNTGVNNNFALKGFAGVVLVIGWAIHLRATFHALGFLGVTLAVGFFASLTWVIVDWGWLAADNIKALSYIGLVITSWVLTTGLSWSFIRRKMSGQYGVVESDQDKQ